MRCLQILILVQLSFTLLSSCYAVMICYVDQLLEGIFVSEHDKIPNTTSIYNNITIVEL